MVINYLGAVTVVSCWTAGIVSYCGSIHHRLTNDEAGVASELKLHFQDLHTLQSRHKTRLDGCIAWNAHNTILGSNHSAICAQVVYFLHSTMPSVTRLNSRWWLAACDWVMSALSAVLSTRVGRRRKFGKVSCTECIVE